MNTVSTADQRVSVRAANIGGIDEATVELLPGVNVLSGRNATNRTSFLQAIMAALGSDRPSLKGDAEEGHAELTIGDESFTRALRREGQGVRFDGHPYTDDAVAADLFAFLLESNDARRAVERGDDLRELAMRPVDTEAIRAEIDSLRSRKREIESGLDQRDEYREQLARLEDDVDQLDNQIQEKRAELEDKEAEIESADADLEESRESQATLESKLDELQEKRSTLEDVHFRLETERETVSELRDERETVTTELADLSDESDDEIGSLDEQLSELHEQKRVVDSKISQLQTLIQFNEEFLDGPGDVELDVPTHDESTAAAELTEQLVTGTSSFHCWTCGGETTVADIEETLDGLRDRRRALIDERNSLANEIETVTERKQAIEDRRERRTTLIAGRDRIEEDIADAERGTGSLQDQKAVLEDEIDGLEAAVEDLRVDEYDEIIDLNIEANALELEIEQLTSQLERTTGRISEVNERLDELADQDAELEQVETQLEAARTRIERIETTVVEAFNDHIAALLSRLEYDNIERIWLERVERDVREGRRKVKRGFFELHVVRSTDDGTVYEDTLDHLSESERAVTGLVFALAGYLAHEAHETVPFILLDSLEAIDAERLANLVDYLREYVGYLVVALLPEDAAGLDEDYHYVTDI